MGSEIGRQGKGREPQCVGLKDHRTRVSASPVYITARSGHYHRQNCLYHY